jgi:hypothetical protein
MERLERSVDNEIKALWEGIGLLGVHGIWTEDLYRQIRKVPEPYQSNLLQAIAEIAGTGTWSRDVLVRELQQMEEAKRVRLKLQLSVLVHETQRHFSPMRGR